MTIDRTLYFKETTYAKEPHKITGVHNNKVIKTQKQQWFSTLEQKGAPVGFALLRGVKTDVTSIVVIYNVLSHHAEFLAPPKLTPDGEAICPATERLSRTTGQWDGSCLTQCFPQPTLFASNYAQSEVQRTEQIFVSKDEIISKNHNFSTHRPAE